MYICGPDFEGLEKKMSFRYILLGLHTQRPEGKEGMVHLKYKEWPIWYTRHDRFRNTSQQHNTRKANGESSSLRPVSCYSIFSRPRQEFTRCKSCLRKQPVTVDRIERQLTGRLTTLIYFTYFNCRRSFQGIFLTFVKKTNAY